MKLETRIKKLAFEKYSGMGMFHNPDRKELVATNSHVLIMSRPLYDASKAGEVIKHDSIRSSGKVEYPHYSHLVPNREKAIKKWPINIPRITRVKDKAIYFLQEKESKAYFVERLNEERIGYAFFYGAVLWYCQGQWTIHYYGENKPALLDDGRGTEILIMPMIIRD